MHASSPLTHALKRNCSLPNVKHVVPVSQSFLASTKTAKPSKNHFVVRDYCPTKKAVSRLSVVLNEKASSTQWLRIPHSMKIPTLFVFRQINIPTINNVFFIHTNTTYRRLACSSTHSPIHTRRPFRGFQPQRGQRTESSADSLRRASGRHVSPRSSLSSSVAPPHHQRLDASRRWTRAPRMTVRCPTNAVKRS